MYKLRSARHKLHDPNNKKQHDIVPCCFSKPKYRTLPEPPCGKSAASNAEGGIFGVRTDAGTSETGGLFPLAAQEPHHHEVAVLAVVIVALLLNAFLLKTDPAVEGQSIGILSNDADGDTVHFKRVESKA